MKAQLSAEMIILVAVLLAVIAIVAISVVDLAEKGKDKVENASEDIFSYTEEQMNNLSKKECEILPLASI